MIAFPLKRHHEHLEQQFVLFVINVEKYLIALLISYFETKKDNHRIRTWVGISLLS